MFSGQLTTPDRFSYHTGNQLIYQQHLEQTEEEKYENWEDYPGENCSNLFIYIFSLLTVTRRSH